MGNNFGGNFGFRGLEKLTKQLRSEKRDGWVQRFEDPAAQFTLLHRLAIGIEYEWGSTQGMRPLYATFLGEAAVRLAAPGLGKAAEKFRESAGHWQRMTDLALPENVPGLGSLAAAIDDVEARRMTDASHPLLGESPMDAMRAEFVEAGGLSVADRRAQFDAMAAELDTIGQLELSAVEMMRAAL